MSLVANRPDLLPSEKKKISYISLFSHLALALFLSIFILIILYVFFTYPYKNKSTSMQPALKKNAILWLEKNPNPASLQKGDIVLIKAKYQTSENENERVYLLRIAALQGDLIEIKDKTVYINNKKEKGKYKILHKDKRVFPASISKRDNFEKIRIRKNQLFLLADNRDEGFDSRYFGPLPLNNVLAKIK